MDGEEKRALGAQLELGPEARQQAEERTGHGPRPLEARLPEGEVEGRAGRQHSHDDPRTRFGGRSRRDLFVEGNRGVDREGRRHQHLLEEHVRTPAGEDRTSEHDGQGEAGHTVQEGAVFELASSQLEFVGHRVEVTTKGVVLFS